MAKLSLAVQTIFVWKSERVREKFFKKCLHSKSQLGRQKLPIDLIGLLYTARFLEDYSNASFMLNFPQKCLNYAICNFNKSQCCSLAENLFTFWKLLYKIKIISFTFWAIVIKSLLWRYEYKYRRNDCGAYSDTAFVALFTVLFRKHLFVYKCRTYTAS